MTPINTMGELTKKLAESIERTWSLDDVDTDNLYFRKGKVSAFLDVLDWLGKDFKLTGIVRGGEKRD